MAWSTSPIRRGRRREQTAPSEQRRMHLTIKQETETLRRLRKGRGSRGEGVVRYRRQAPPILQPRPQPLIAPTGRAARDSEKGKSERSKPPLRVPRKRAPRSVSILDRGAGIRLRQFFRRPGRAPRARRPRRNLCRRSINTTLHPTEPRSRAGVGPADTTSDCRAVRRPPMAGVKSTGVPQRGEQTGWR